MLVDRFGNGQARQPLVKRHPVGVADMTGKLRWLADMTMHLYREITPPITQGLAKIACSIRQHMAAFTLCSVYCQFTAMCWDGEVRF